MVRLGIAILLVVVLLTANLLVGCAGSSKDTAEIHYNQGLDCLVQRRYNDAIQKFDEAIRLNPEYYKAYNSRGVAYHGMGQFERATDDYDEAIRLNPEHDMVFNNRGLTYLNMGQFERAIDDYDEAIRLNPELAEAYYNRGLAHNNLGQKSEAISDFEKFITLTNNPQWIETARQHIEELSK